MLGRLTRLRSVTLGLNGGVVDAAAVLANPGVERWEVRTGEAVGADLEALEGYVVRALAAIPAASAFDQSLRGGFVLLRGSGRDPQLRS